MSSPAHFIEFLPAIYQGGAGPADSDRNPFLYFYLLPFQKIFLGWQEAAREEGKAQHVPANAQALEVQIDQFSQLLDPEKAPERFLPWLSDWVALNIHVPLTSKKRRQLIGRFISLNRIRGTKKYLEELLPFFVDAGVSIEEEQSPESQIHVHSTLGLDFQIGGGPAHVFRVVLTFAATLGEELERQCRAAHYVIAMSKPAHTRYEMQVISPVFQIGKHSTIGRDTILP